MENMTLTLQEEEGSQSYVINADAILRGSVPYFAGSSEVPKDEPDPGWTYEPDENKQLEDAMWGYPTDVENRENYLHHLNVSRLDKQPWFASY